MSASLLTAAVEKLKQDDNCAGLGTLEGLYNVVHESRVRRARLENCPMQALRVAKPSLAEESVEGRGVG